MLQSVQSLTHALFYAIEKYNCIKFSGISIYVKNLNLINKNAEPREGDLSKA